MRNQQLSSSLYRIIHPHKHSFSGIFIIVDGKVYIKNVKDVSRVLHMDLFEEILRYDLTLKCYAHYPYYYFPRGSIISSETSSWILVNVPNEFGEAHIEKLIRLFGHEDKEREKIEGEHYSFDFIESQIRSLSWSLEVIEDEIIFVRDFFGNQIKAFLKRDISREKRD